jgi:hypothetical protein
MEELPRAWPEQKTQWRFPKMHLSTHYSDCITRGGVTIQYNANLYEHLHINIVKRPWRCSNKRDATGQVAAHWSRGQLLHSLEDSTGDRSSYMTAMDKVC